MTVQGRGQRCPTGMRKVPQPSKESEIEMLGTSFGLDVAVPVDHHSLQHPKDTDTARRREDDDCVRARETQIESMAVVTINNPAFLRDERLESPRTCLAASRSNRDSNSSRQGERPEYL